MLRIGQFIDTDGAGGAEVLMLELSAALKQKGIQPVILHFGGPYISRRAKELELETAVVSSYAWYKSIATLPLFALSAARQFRQLKLDLLHSHLFGPVTAGAMAAFLCGMPHVGTLHDTYIVEERPSRIMLLQLAALLGTRLVAVCSFMESYYRSMAKFSQSRLQTIHNGVVPTVASPGQRQAVRTQLKIRPDEVIVITVGRLVELKQQHFPIRAIQALQSQYSVRLLIVGDGPCRAELEQLAKELNVSSHVSFLGSRDDVPALLAAGDVFTLSSRTEGLSRSILEAMSAGLAIVASDVGGNYELIGDTQHGRLVTANEVGPFIAALRELIADPELRIRLGTAARQRAQESFSFETMVNKYVALYRGSIAKLKGHRSL